IMSLSLLVSIFFNSYPYLFIFIPSLLPSLLFCDVSRIIWRIGWKLSKRLCYQIRERNTSLHKSYIISIVYVLLYRSLHNLYIAILLNIVTNIFMEIPIRKQLIVALLIGTTYFSSFNLFHVTTNLLILYIWNGLFDPPDWNSTLSWTEQLIEQVHRL